jgi:hypothetical protein
VQVLKCDEMNDDIKKNKDWFAIKLSPNIRKILLVLCDGMLMSNRIRCSSWCMVNALASYVACVSLFPLEL